MRTAKQPKAGEIDILSFRGKARPIDPLCGPGWHPLAFHNVDVAAVGEALLTRHQGIAAVLVLAAGLAGAQTAGTVWVAGDLDADERQGVERYSTIDGAESCKVALEKNNMQVDDRGPIYLADRADAGVNIVALTSRAILKV